MPNKLVRGGKRRAVVIVVDGCGAGASPDAEDFGDPATSNTLANVAQAVGGLNMPNLARLGLGNITDMVGVPKQPDSLGMFGKLREKSNAKDTQTGHWEMMGIVSEEAFPTFPNGFPEAVIDQFVSATGCGGVLCNKPASGTDILNELGPEHEQTKLPIVYTSGDSVFQIACHVGVIPLPTLYKWCEIARELLQGPYRVGRVIARPFEGEPGNYRRLQGERRDLAVPPPVETFLNKVQSSGSAVFGVGKIEDIFVGQGLNFAKHTALNSEGLELTLKAIQNQIDYDPLRVNGAELSEAQLIFTNLVDTDSLYGHRRDAQGYAKALTEIDQWMGKIIPALEEDDLLIISSDHGNDPTMPGTDHTREDVPVIIYSPSLSGKSAHTDLGVRDGFSDIAATLSSWLGVGWTGAGSAMLA